MGTSVSEHVDHISENMKPVLDGVSLITVVGTLTSILPSIAAVLSIAWSLIRLYESKTVQGWIASTKTLMSTVWVLIQFCAREVWSKIRARFTR